MSPVVVIPCRPSVANEQLRYAARAWQEYHPDVNIVVIGTAPRWWKGEFVRTPQQPGHNYQWTKNFPNAMRAATKLEHEAFWWSADDIFPLTKVPEPPVTWCRQTNIDYYIDKWSEQRAQPGYVKMFVDGISSQRNILRQLGIETQHNADMHMPHYIEREKLAYLLDLFAKNFPFHPAGHWRAVYGGLWPGTIKRVRDPKLSGRNVNVDWDLGWISTSAMSWRGPIGNIIRNKFPTASRFE